MSESTSELVATPEQVMEQENNAKATVEQEKENTLEGAEEAEVKPEDTKQTVDDSVEQSTPPAPSDPIEQQETESETTTETPHESQETQQEQEQEQEQVQEQQQHQEQPEQEPVHQQETARSTPPPSITTAEMHETTSFSASSPPPPPLPPQVDLEEFNALKLELESTKDQMKDMQVKFDMLFATVSANTEAAEAKAAEDNTVSKLEHHINDQVSRIKTRLAEVEKKERLKSATAAYNNVSKSEQDLATDVKVAQLEQMLVGMLMPHITGKGRYEGPIEYSDAPPKRNSSAGRRSASKRPPSRGANPKLPPMDFEESSTSSMRRSSLTNSIPHDSVERERRISALEHGISSLLLAGTQPLSQARPPSRSTLTSGKHQRLDMSKLTTKIDQQATLVTKLQGQVRRLINSLASVKKELQGNGQFGEFVSPQSSKFANHSGFTPYIPIPIPHGKKTNHAGPVGRTRQPNARLSTAPNAMYKN